MATGIQACKEAVWTNRTPPQKVVILTLTLLALFIITTASLYAAKIDSLHLSQWAKVIKQNVTATFFAGVTLIAGSAVLWILPVKKKDPVTPPPPEAQVPAEEHRPPPQLGLPQQLGSRAVAKNANLF